MGTPELDVGTELDLVSGGLPTGVLTLTSPLRLDAGPLTAVARGSRVADQDVFGNRQFCMGEIHRTNSFSSGCDSRSAEDNGARRGILCLVTASPLADNFERW